MRKGVILLKYPNLRAEMARVDIGVEGLCMATGLSVSSVYRRLKKDGFSYQEAEQIRNMLFPSMSVDYLFDGEGVS